MYEGKCPKEAGRTQIIHYTRGKIHGNCVINEEQVIEVKRLLAQDI